MVQQLEREPDLSKRRGSPWRRIVVFERIARGAGATRWHLARDDHELRRVFGLLRPGSRVTFCFAGPLRVEPLTEEVIGRMFAAVGVANDIMIGTPGPDRLTLAATLVAGPSELTEFLMQPHPPLTEVVWGHMPGVDAPDAVTVVLVDEDGVLRPHPH
jgi:hypothetical protein